MVWTNRCSHVAGGRCRPPAIVIVLSVLTAVGALTGLTGGQVSAAPPLWGLRTGDSFLVDVFTSRESFVKLGAEEPLSAEWIDRLELEYRVENASPSGRLLIRVRIRGGGRQSDSGDQRLSVLADQRLPLLDGAQLTMDVASDGLVERISPGDRAALISLLSGANSATQSLLEQSCSDDTLKAWFSRPLWFAKDLKTLQPGQSWDCSEQISLGMLGGIRTSVRIQVPEAGDAPGAAENRSLTLKGSGRFIPLSPAGKSTSPRSVPPLRFTDAEATLDEYSGTATLSISAPPDSLSAGRRPQFEKLDLEFAFHGTCQVLMGEKSMPVEFRQRQRQSWSLRSWRMGGPFFTDPGDTPAVPQPLPDRPPE